MTKFWLKQLGQGPGHRDSCSCPLWCHPWLKLKIFFWATPCWLQAWFCSAVANRCFPNLKELLELEVTVYNNETIGKKQLQQGVEFVTYCDIIQHAIVTNSVFLLGTFCLHLAVIISVNVFEQTLIFCGKTRRETNNRKIESYTVQPLKRNAEMHGLICHTLILLTKSRALKMQNLKIAVYYHAFPLEMTTGISS